MENLIGLSGPMESCAKVAAGLLNANAYSHAVEPIKMIETHISWVLLTGQYAYKLKKPVDLGFVDFSTLALRKHFCDEEVRLNRRLAPQLYVAVVDITGSPDSPKLEGTGPVIEHAVKMRQFDHESTLDHLLARKRITVEALQAFATELAEFHLALPPCDPGWPHGSVEAITTASQENFAQLAELLKDPDELKRLRGIQQWSDSRLLALSDCMRQRKLGGWVRECHGDLHTGNIVLLKGRLVAFDCLEFNQDLRWLDVISEIAFLGMDLAARGREDLAFSLFNRYLESTADYAAAKLIDYYRVHYSMVRAKVAALTAGQRHDAHAEIVTQPSTADFLDLAGELAHKPKPQLLLTHGLSGSGKTWLTDRLLSRLPAIRVRADVLRKSLHGLGASADSRSGIDADLYSKHATQQTYDHLGRIARDLLTAGFTVIIDAACLKTWQRRIFGDVADACGVEWRILDCHAPDGLLRHRIEARKAEGIDASEAGIAVLDHQIQTREPLTSAEKTHTIRVSVSGDLDIGTLVGDLLPPPVACTRETQ